MNAKTAIHEAAHASAALLLGRRVDYVRVEPGNKWRDEQLGGTGVPLLDGRFQPSDLIIRLAGYAGELAGWPPPFEKACGEDLEEVDIIIDALDLTAEQYEQLVAQAQAMLRDPRFTRLRGALARLLAITPRLERGDIERLAAAHGVHRPDEQQQAEEPACST
jgi:hypothetical protein